MGNCIAQVTSKALTRGVFVVSITSQAAANQFASLMHSHEIKLRNYNKASKVGVDACVWILPDRKEFAYQRVISSAGMPVYTVNQLATILQKV